MQINKDEMAEALKTIMPGVGDDFYFIFAKDKIISYNNTISISTPFKSDVEGAAPASEIYTLLQKCKQKEIQISEKDNDLVFNISKKAKAGVKLNKDIAFPALIDNKEKWKKIPGDLQKALHFCSFSVSKDHSKPLLNCISIADDFVQSSDNYRATKYKIKEKTGLNVLIPNLVIQKLNAFKAEEYIEKENWLHFKDKKGSVFSCRVLKDEFKDVSSLLEIEGELIEFPPGIQESIEKSIIFSQKEEGFTHLLTDISLKKNLIIVKGQSEKGWYLEKTKTKYTDLSFSFSINAEFFLDILKKTNKCIIDKETSKIKFQKDAWEHLFLFIHEN